MIRQDFKQTRMLLRKHPLFSSLYILGTALALAATMVIAIIYYIKIAPIYPEYNRNNTSYITNAQFTKTTAERGMLMWAFSYYGVCDLFYPLENVEAVSASTTGFNDDYGYVQSNTSNGEIEVLMKLTDPAFFKIYTFKFYEGAPFTQIDFDSGLKVAVITEELAQKLFNRTNDVIGRTFDLAFVVYTVC